MTTWKCAGALLAGVGAAAFAGLAAQAEELEEITVSASPLGDVFQPAWVLDEEDLFARKQPTLGETLDGELGVSSTYFGPASSRPVIRGISGSRVVMLSDSIASLDVADVSADHAVTIEPLLANAIEIIRGPTTLLYGNSAAGGVVNVLDNRIPMTIAERPVSGALELRGDSASEERAMAARLDGGVGGFAWHLSGFDRETDDIDIKGFATADPAERSDEEQSGTLANSFSESDGLSGGVSWVGERGYIGVSVGDLSNTYGLPGPEEDHEGEEGEEEEEEAGGGPFIDMEQTRFDVRGEFRPQSGLFESISGAFANNDYEHSEVEPSGEVGTFFDNDAWQFRLEGVHKPLSNWRGAVGVQLDDRDFSAEGEEAFITPTQTESTGIFLVEEREVDWGRIRLGGRIESLEHTNADFADYDETSFSFAAGLEADVLADHQFIVNLSRTERHPAAEELYATGPHLATRQFELGLLATGSSAEKETSVNLEVGLARSTPGLRWSVTGYVNDVGDFVYQRLTGDIDDDLPVAQYEQEDGRFIGIEAELIVPVWNLGNNNGELRLFGDFVETELDSGDYLPRIPPWRLGANLVAGTEQWNGSLDFIYHASQDNVSSLATDSYLMVNLSGSLTMDLQSTTVELFARATNLLDEEARKSTSFLAAFAPLRGRSVQVGGRLRF